MEADARLRLEGVLALLDPQVLNDACAAYGRNEIDADVFYADDVMGEVLATGLSLKTKRPMLGRHMLERCEQVPEGVLKAIFVKPLVEDASEALAGIRLMRGKGLVVDRLLSLRPPEGQVQKELRLAGVYCTSIGKL